MEYYRMWWYVIILGVYNRLGFFGGWLGVKDIGGYGKLVDMV